MLHFHSWPSSDCAACAASCLTLSSQKRIVIIDDSLVMRKIVATCLQPEGFQVQEFADGFEALRVLSQSTFPVPHLILLDLVLPRISGYEVARVLKRQERLTSVPLIMLSQRDGTVDRLKARLVGVQTYLCKPFRTEELISIVRTTLYSKDSRDESRPLSAFETHNIFTRG